jgi:hypothetical protein
MTRVSLMVGCDYSRLVSAFSECFLRQVFSNLSHSFRFPNDWSQCNKELLYCYTYQYTDILDETFSQDVLAPFHCIVLHAQIC